MNKEKFFQYEENITLSRLKKMSPKQTFKIGLELSKVALELMFSSFRDQYPAKLRLNKFRSFLRTI
jgi:hypothetical protein